MALHGLRVVELEGLGPGPLAACMLADFGADVVSVSRAVNGQIMSQGDPVSRGKRSVALDLKAELGLKVLKELVARADVFIEAFRPGVAEKLGIGPDVLCEINPRLIYARMTGFGQGGTVFEGMAGHDANYLALSGVLDFFRRGNERPFPPANYAGDYAGGSAMMVIGVLIAYIERLKSGRGQVVDAAMVDGASYIALPLFKWAQAGRFLPVRGDGHVDAERFVLCQGSHYVETYLCKEDGRKPGTRQYMSVQAIEPQFYAELLKGLKLDGETDLPMQNDQSQWQAMKERFTAIFLTKTRDEWAEIFEGSDACCVPVLNAAEAALHPHNVKRGTFAPTPGREGFFEPSPAPHLSRTPGHQPRPSPHSGADYKEVLAELGYTTEQVAALLSSAAVAAPRRSGKGSIAQSATAAPPSKL